MEKNAIFYKRMNKELKLLNNEKKILCVPLNKKMLEWHFTIKGPKKSSYEGGFYHGKINLPDNYPYQPPSVMFLTVI